MKNFFFYISILLLVWITSCNNSNNNYDKIAYSKKGNALVKITFDTLRNSLQTAIGRVGVEGAVAYCQTAALGLTATYTTDAVFVRRTALRYRNLANKPDTTEERILKLFASFKEQGILNDSIKPVTEKDKNGQVHFYKPILLQQMCISCHGNKTTEIGLPVLNAINNLYPLDKAFDFKTGDLRGMWHISFSDKKSRE